MKPIDRIAQRVHLLGDPNDPDVPRALLTIDEFFDGNETVGSILCNVEAPPHPSEVRKLLTEIRSRPEVSDVRIEITMFDDPVWPFSDTVWVMTSASPETAASWFPAALRPDETRAGWNDDVPRDECPVAAGHQPIGCWWD